MGVRQWQPQVGQLVYLRSVDLRHKAAVAVVEDVLTLVGSRDPEWVIVQLVTPYAEYDADGQPIISARAGEIVKIPSYRVEEVRSDEPEPEVTS